MVSLADIFEAQLRPLDDLVELIRPMVSEDLDHCVHKARRKARDLDTQFPNLSEDERAIITLYTMEMYPPEESLYWVLNEALRTQNREQVKPWRDVILLLLTAMKKLPVVQDKVVHRAVRVHARDLGKQAKQGEVFVWHGFASTTPDMSPLEVVGMTGDRTMWILHLLPNFHAVNIQKLSFFSCEPEILLPPNVAFKVRSVLDCGHGLTQVQCEQLQGADELMDFTVPAAVQAAQPAGYQAAAELQRPSFATRTFASSTFKELYNQRQPSKGYSILHFARDYMNWLQAEGFADDVTEAINQKLEKKIREGFTVKQLAIFTWTLLDRVHDRELCSYMNEIVREDSRERLQPLIPLVKAMNSFLVTRGKAAAEWPPENVTYRGAGIPEEHMFFFQSDVQYRCPMFLATSFDHEVAMDFARMNQEEKEREMVIFYVHYDMDLRCKHVNYLKEAADEDVKSEAEFLFPPYSAFTVKSAPEKVGKKWVIHIEAFPDNCKAPEDLPLAPWH